METIIILALVAAIYVLGYAGGYKHGQNRPR